MIAWGMQRFAVADKARVWWLQRRAGLRQAKALPRQRLKF